MSVISNRHSVVAFVAGKSQALTGQRLAKATYKQTDKMTKAGLKALPAICVSVPELPTLTAERLQEFEPHVRALIESTQDKIIASMYEAKKLQIGGSVSDEDIGLDSVLEVLAQTGTGHMTGEKLADWYDTHFSTAVEVFTTEKLVAMGRIAADTAVADYPAPITNILTATVARYREVVKSLAGKNTKLDAKECELLLQLLGMIEDDEDAMQVGVKVQARLQKLLNPAPVVVPADALDLTSMLG